MSKKSLTIAAAVAAALAVVGLGATVHIGKVTDQRYNAQVDRILAELPFLKVEKRNYHRGLLGADAQLVLRFELPALDLADLEDDEDEADDDSADASDDAAMARLAAQPRALILSFDDVINHGPFPGRLLPAAARLDSTLKVAVENGEGKRSVPLTVLTADSVLSFGDDYHSRYASPAGQWVIDQGQANITWAGMTGEARGNLTSLASRYSMQSPGFSIRALDHEARPSEVVIGALKTEGHNDASKSLLTAPGRMTMTLASLRFAARDAGGAPMALVLDDLVTQVDTTLTADLLDIRTTSRGKGRYNAMKIDGFEMVEHWRRLHAPSLEAVIRQIYASFGQPGTDDPAVLLEPFIASLENFLPHDPEYAVEKLDLTLDGRKASFAWRFGLKGASADLLENPMALAAVASAGLEARLPRQWLDGLLAQGDSLSTVVEVDRLGNLIAEGEQMGFIVVDGDELATTVKFDQGSLDVNGRTVFRLPVLR